MDTRDLFERLGLALAIGLLIGLERGWRERDMGSGKRAAGIRTFALIGLLGGLWGAMTPTLGPVPMAAASLAFAVAFTLFEWRESVAQDDYSVTTTIAGFIVFALGAFAVLGNRAAAGAAAVAVVALLAARNSLHQFLKKLSWLELRSVVVLLTMTFVLLPVLPDRPIDPWDAINPYELWLLVVLIGASMPSILAEISFVTNPQDAKLLKNSNYRQRIAQALFDGVRKYQTSLKNAPAVAHQN